MWSKVHIKLRHPHAPQRKVLECRAKRIVVKSGRRGGKTMCAVDIAVSRFSQGQRILYVVPVETQATSFWREVCLALGPAIREQAFRKSEDDRTIEKPESTQAIMCRTSWNPDALRSDYADVLICDEWQLQNERVWSEVGAPMLLDRDGTAYFLFTPPSYHSRDISRARDRLHAVKLFRFAEQDRTGRWATFAWTSHDNPHLSKVALAEIASDMTGLAYRQEILGEIIEENPTALWKRETIERNRVTHAPDLVRIIVALDPSVTSKDTSDEAGIVIAGLDANHHGYVLGDLSRRDTPQGWASATVGAFHANLADAIAYEQNQGGDLIPLTIHTIDPNVPCKSVVASRGKAVRADPIAALYEQDRVSHVGMFPALEDELCGWTPGDPSPNRLDACVYALSELMLTETTLGLIEFFQSGRAAAELARIETAKATQTTMIPARPAAKQDTDVCPQCGSNLVSPQQDGQLRCASCGHHYWPEGTKRGVTYAGFLGNQRPGLIRR